MTGASIPTKNAAPHLEKGHSVGYADLYDAYFCHDCNEWLEERCKDPACEECAERPDRPLL